LSPRPLKEKTPSFLGDPRLVPRLREYMADSPFRHLSPSRINFLLVANDMMSTYSEYRRKKIQPFKVSIESAWKIIIDEDRTAKERSVAQGGWSREQRQQPADGDENSLTEPIYIEDFSGSDSPLETLKEEPPNLVAYEDTNAVNAMMQGLYSQSSSRKLVTQSAPASPAAKREARDAPRTPTESGGGVGGSGGGEQRSSEGRIAKSSSAKKKLKKNDKRESTHDSMAILRELKKDGVGQEVTPNKSKSLTTPKKSEKKFSDIGGMESTIKEVCKLLVHLKHPEVLSRLGISPPKGVLLHGPPGCGKTLLANCIAGEIGLPMFSVSGPEIVSGVSGESEQNIRNLFQSAKAQAPCILFLDEVDVIAGDRESASKDMERRIVAQLLSCMDELNGQPDSEKPEPDSTSGVGKDEEEELMETEKDPPSASADSAASASSLNHILVIGATSRLQAVDPSLRRAGRFDREISLGIPDEKSRRAILNILCAETALDPALSLPQLARDTPGYCGADLMALCREAAMVAVDRILKTNLEPPPSGSSTTTTTMEPGSMSTTTMEPGSMTTTTREGLNLFQWLLHQPPISTSSLADMYITRSDFSAALKLVQPSAKREGFATVPDVTWDDIGALSDVREELSISILAPIRFPEQFERLGLTQPPGILLAGPPGCGKTLLAKAIANESGLNFISVKGPELLNMYVGESERAIRTVFERARNSAPSVIFFDEIDSLCPKRSASSSDSSARVVNQLLTEMDGLEVKGKHVFVIGATNRPDILDPAVLRPGRLDKILFVGFPSAAERAEILEAITRRGTRPPLAADVTPAAVAADARSEGLTGADLAALVREASVAALKDMMGGASTGLSRRKRDFDGNPVLEGGGGGGGVEPEVTMATTTTAVSWKHFESAFKKLKPSVSKKDRVLYEEIRTKAIDLD